MGKSKSKWKLTPVGKGFVLEASGFERDFLKRPDPIVIAPSCERASEPNSSPVRNVAKPRSSHGCPPSRALCEQECLWNPDPVVKVPSEHASEPDLFSVAEVQLSESLPVELASDLDPPAKSIGLSFSDLRKKLAENTKAMELLASDFIQRYRTVPAKREISHLKSSDEETITVVEPAQIQLTTWVESRDMDAVSLRAEQITDADVSLMATPLHGASVTEAWLATTSPRKGSLAAAEGTIVATPVGAQLCNGMLQQICLTPFPAEDLMAIHSSAGSPLPLVEFTDVHLKPRSYANSADADSSLLGTQISEAVLNSYVAAISDAGHVDGPKEAEFSGQKSVIPTVADFYTKADASTGDCDAENYPTADATTGEAEMQQKAIDSIEIEAVLLPAVQQRIIEANDQSVAHSQQLADLKVADKVSMRNRKITDVVRLRALPNVPKDIYKFTLEEVAEAEKEWSATLIGALIGSPLSYNAMVEFMKDNWQVALPKLFIKDNGVLVLKFKNAEDRSWVLNRGPWLIGGNKPLMLKEWCTGMSID